MSVSLPSKPAVRVLIGPGSWPLHDKVRAEFEKSRDTDSWIATCVPYRNDSRANFSALSKELLTDRYDAVIGGAFLRVNSALLSQLKRLKAISLVSAGYDKIDIDACRAHRVSVTNVSRALADTTADHVVAVMLAACRQLLPAYKRLAKSEIPAFHTLLMAGRDLHHSRVGVIGLGSIGHKLVKRLRAFDCQVLYNNRKRLPLSDEKRLGVSFASFDQIVASCDFVVPLCPLTAQTENMFSETVFRRMKSSAIFINAGRGKLCDTGALVKALREGWIYGAGLDCTDPEPLPAGHPLLSLQNSFVVPHIGSATIGCRHAMLDMAIDNLKCAWYQRPCANYVCNPPNASKL